MIKNVAAMHWTQDATHMNGSRPDKMLHSTVEAPGKSEMDSKSFDQNRTFQYIVENPNSRKENTLEKDVGMKNVFMCVYVRMLLCM